VVLSRMESAGGSAEVSTMNCPCPPPAHLTRWRSPQRVCLGEFHRCWPFRTGPGPTWKADGKQRFPHLWNPAVFHEAPIWRRWNLEWSLPATCVHISVTPSDSHPTIDRRALRRGTRAGGPWRDRHSLAMAPEESHRVGGWSPPLVASKDNVTSNQNSAPLATGRQCPSINLGPEFPSEWGAASKPLRSGSTPTRRPFRAVSTTRT